MTTTHRVVVWDDVSPLPDIHVERGDVYLRFPSRTTAERARDGLRQAGFQVKITAELVLCVPDVDPPSPLRHVVGLLTPPERAETFATLKPSGASLDTVDRLQAMNVARLRDRLASTWLIELLRDHHLSCVFQPIVRADDPASVLGYEALARGVRDSRPVDPARMIEVAENAHLMSQLDALAMQFAIAQAARSELRKKLFLNCAPSHIFDPFTRMDELADYCVQAGLEPSQIVLEVIESEKNDEGHLKNFIRAARAKQFAVALDDLGSAYSTLGALTALRPDIIKIDRGLVTAINTDPYRALIVNRILDAARVIGTPTIVEGIETEAELNWARTNGATYVQGYLLGKPAPLPSTD